MESSKPTHRGLDSDSLLPYALGVAPAALGCAAGVLIGGKMKEEARPTLAVSLLGVAVLAAAPLAVDYVKKRVNGPASIRASRRRLRSIRDSSLPAEEDIYSLAHGEEEKELVTM